MADSDTFKDIQRASSLNKYPDDNSKLRQKHADYARELLGRVKAEEGVIIAALRAKQALEWEESSQFAKDHPFEQVLTAFPHVERFMARQQTRHEEGKTVELIDGRRRRVLEQACAALFTHMKSFFNSGVAVQPIDADDFAEDLAQVTPDAGEIVSFFS